MTSAIVSRGFTGRWGRAYLVAAPAIDSLPSPSLSSRLASPSNNGAELPSLPNTHVHRPVPRQLVTGAHTVSDVSCAFCGSVLGWKYVAAEEDSQRYKVGKFILETKRVSVVADWEGALPSREEGQDVHRPLDSLGSASEDLPPPPERLDGLPVPEHDEVAFDSQDEDECEDLFAGVWTPAAAARRRRSKRWDRADV